VVLPLFALANAGVPLSADKLGLVASPVAWGIFLGLFLGKQIGISFFSWMVIRAGGAALPTGVSWRQIYGARCLAGIGFTMSLFVTDLAFEDDDLVNAAKLGIISASVVSAAVGYAVLRSSLPAAGQLPSENQQ
jgi:NhaA family Na+:H+ antiporter